MMHEELKLACGTRLVPTVDEDQSSNQYGSQNSKLWTMNQSGLLCRPHRATRNLGFFPAKKATLNIIEVMGVFKKKQPSRTGGNNTGRLPK